MRRYKNCKIGAVACSDTWLQPACAQPVLAAIRPSASARNCSSWGPKHIAGPRLREVMEEREGPSFSMVEAAPEDTQSEVKLLRAELQDQARLGPDSKPRSDSSGCFQMARQKHELAACRKSRPKAFAASCLAV